MVTHPSMSTVDAGTYRTLSEFFPVDSKIPSRISPFKDKPPLRARRVTYPHPRALELIHTKSLRRHNHAREFGRQNLHWYTLTVQPNPAIPYQNSSVFHARSLLIALNHPCPSGGKGLAFEIRISFNGNAGLCQIRSRDVVRCCGYALMRCCSRKMVLLCCSCAQCCGENMVLQCGGQPPKTNRKAGSRNLNRRGADDFLMGNTDRFAKRWRVGSHYDCGSGLGCPRSPSWM